jgi:hypothetical protein
MQAAWQPKPTSLNYTYCCCCCIRQDSVLQLGPNQQLQVLRSLPADAPCPPLDIAFRSRERSIGMCTDAAPYVIYAGARIIPLLQGGALQQYNARCGNRIARMFLETMYHEWLSPENESLHVMQVRSRRQDMQTDSSWVQPLSSKNICTAAVTD